jgi:DNA-binding transcriptional MerR regulator
MKGRREEVKGWVKIGELIKRTGVTKATVHHYLKMGLLPKVIRKNRRMIYYHPSCVERILQIKELQEKRFLPLSVIKKVIKKDGILNVDTLILEEFSKKKKYTMNELKEKSGLPEEFIEKLVKIGLLSSQNGLFSEEDMRILSLVKRMREKGINEDNGFQPENLKMFVQAMESLIDTEFKVFNRITFGKLPPDRIAELGKTAVLFISEMLSPLHYRMIMDRLQEIENKKQKRR